jgi:hypothetical protein
MRRNSRLGGAALVVLTFGALVAMASRADAYCRTSVCNGQTASVCTPETPDDCGIPLYWPVPCVGFSMQEDASGQVPLDVATDIMRTAFSTWISAFCGAESHPNMEIYDQGPVACNQHEYNQEQGNANIIMFRDDGWPYGGGNATLALTTVTYNLDNGEIYDADMELNSAQTPFTTGDENVEFDLLSIMTHEAGHFLGLAHSALSDATMNRNYKQHTTNLRDLSADDIEAICDAYRPGATPINCDPTPRHGFQSMCANPPPGKAGCCSVAPGAPVGDANAVTALALGALLLAARRSRGRGDLPGKSRVASTS